MVSPLSSRLVRILVCAAALACPAAVVAQEPAYLSAVECNALVERAAETLPATINMPLVDGDRVRTTDGRVIVRFPDGSAIEIGAYSEIEMIGATRLRVI